MNLECPVHDPVFLVPSAALEGTQPEACTAPDFLKLYHTPCAWRRWLDWVPKVCLPPQEILGSPFTSPANTSLHQRIFLNGTAIEFPLK